jgi:Subtilase family
VTTPEGANQTKPVRWGSRVLLLVLALAVLPAAAAEAHEPAPEPETSPNAVVAFIDTGINPYHKVFRDTSARAQRHPSTYLPGFPKNAQALRLTLDAKKYYDAVKADCKRIWSKVKPGKLYWFPGTKIVGGITFVPGAEMPCDVPEPQADGHILDAGGHGTMVASRGAATEYGACKECLVVSVQMPTSVNIVDPSESTTHSINAIEWAAANADWIDAQSNSWGPIVPLWEPTGEAGLLTSNPDLVRSVEKVSRKHLAFWASGNGAAFRGGVVGHPTLLSPHLGPSAIIVGGHDSGYVNTWPGFPPHLVSDSCSSWAAYRDEIKKSAEDVGGGTSGATPFVAGGAARILLEARKVLGDHDTGVQGGVVARGPAGRVSSGPLKDGKFTLQEWRDVLYKTASERPKTQKEDGPTCETGQFGPTPVKWTDVPDEYPEYAHIGYGAVDAQSHDLAMKVLEGSADMPDRSDTDRYFTLDRQAREALHQVFRGVLGN